MRKLKPKETKRQCTGMTARWCPNCGVCQCRRSNGPLWEDMDDPMCPLHSPVSPHAVVFHDHMTGDPTKCDECAKQWHKEHGRDRVQAHLIRAVWIMTIFALTVVAITFAFAVVSYSGG